MSRLKIGVIGGAVIIAACFAIWLGVRGGDEPVSSPYANPVFAHDAPDPSAPVYGEDGYYYLVTTQSMYEDELKLLPILRSRNLVDWEYAGAVFDTLPDWLHQEQVNVWAPDLVKHNDQYYVYYSGKTNGSDPEVDMAIGVAVADHPLGPYKDLGKPLIGDHSFVAIDSFVFNDDDGTRYLYWGSGHAPIKVRQLADDGTTFIGEQTDVLSADPNAYYEKLVEGAWVVKRDGYYYLFVSGDACCGANAFYAVMVARGESPTGPFTRYREAGGGPILAMNDRFNAPGHHSMFTDEEGQDWMFYHAIDRNNSQEQNPFDRYLMLDRVDWIDGWPVINEGKGPSDAEQPGPAIFQD